MENLSLNRRVLAGPRGYEVVQTHVKQAIDLVDKHHAEGTTITDDEVNTFPWHVY